MKIRRFAIFALGAILLSSCGLPNKGDSRPLTSNSFPIEVIASRMGVDKRYIPNYGEGSSYTYTYQYLIDEEDLTVTNNQASSLIMTIEGVPSTALEDFTHAFGAIVNTTPETRYWLIDTSDDGSVVISNTLTMSTQNVVIQATMQESELLVLFEKVSSDTSRAHPGEVNPFSGKENPNVFVEWLGVDIPHYTKGSTYRTHRGLNANGHRTVLFEIYGLHILDGTHTTIIEDYIDFFADQEGWTHERTWAYSESTGLATSFFDTLTRTENNVTTYITSESRTSNWNNYISLTVWTEEASEVSL